MAWSLQRPGSCAEWHTGLCDMRHVVPCCVVPGHAMACHALSRCVPQRTMCRTTLCHAPRCAGCHVSLGTVCHCAVPHPVPPPPRHIPCHLPLALVRTLGTALLCPRTHGHPDTRTQPLSGPWAKVSSLFPPAIIQKYRGATSPGWPPPFSQYKIILIFINNTSLHS